MLVYTDPNWGCSETSQAADSRAGPKTVSLETLGCKLNQADTQALSREFVRAGYRMVSQDDHADV